MLWRPLCVNLCSCANRLTIVLPWLLALATLWFSTIGVAAADEATADFIYPNSTLELLAFGSCHKNKYANPQIWRSVKSLDPQAWIWMGDAVYPPVRGISSVHLLEKEYDKLKNNQSLGYSDFYPGRFVFGTWDDHDYGANDAGREMPYKVARAAAPTDNDGNLRQGMYSSVVWGEPPRQVKLIMLDTRWHRENHCIPSLATKIPLGAGIACATRWLSAGLFPNLCKHDAAMLGEQQWKWFENQITSSQAAVHIVVSSVQVLTTNPAMESWGHYPSERDRLIRLLSKTRNVVLLSGDVHHGEILDPLAAAHARTTRKDSGKERQKYGFLEVTSSGMTHDCSKHIYGKMCKPLLDIFHHHRFADVNNYFIGRNFGAMTIDWESNSMEVSLRKETGESVLTTGVIDIKPSPPDPWSDEDYRSVLPCMNGHLQPLAWSAVAVLIGSLLLSRWLRKTRP